MRFKLNKEEFELVRAALRFGDWIILQPESTHADHAAIVELKAALLKLPEPTFGTNLTFGVSMVKGDMNDKFLARGWQVSIENVEESQLELIIYSHWTPYPPVDEYEMAERELSFHRFLGDPSSDCNHNFDLWISEIENMDKIREECSEINIDCASIPVMKFQQSALKG